jgi:Mg-chelatase subunit ChlD
MSGYQPMSSGREDIDTEFDTEFDDEIKDEVDREIDDEIDSSAFGDQVEDRERLRRWRLVLGGEGGSHGQSAEGFSLDSLVSLSKQDQQRDGALGALYSEERSGGLGGSSPRVARWLGDIRTYFPVSVVKVLQRDALERFGLRQLLMEKEMLESVEPDIHMVSTIVALNHLIPESSKETARSVVRALVRQLEAKLAAPMRDAVVGALNRSMRTNRPKRPSDIDWNRTIRANLRHYIAEKKTIIPERLIGYGRRSTEVQRDIVLCIDQSGSMAASVVYSSVFAAVLASLRSVRTRLVVFDTAIVDLTDLLDDPVDILFGVQLGGGTDIAGALSYCESQITSPAQTILILISDLYEGGLTEKLMTRAASLVASGVQVIALLALSDEGKPAYDVENAAGLAGLGIPAFACTPDAFPELMATAIMRQDISQWAASRGIVTAVPVK